MKQDNSLTEVKKPEKNYVNKQLSGASRYLVTHDNAKKELIKNERKCEENRTKYEYLSGENVERLFAEYFNGTIETQQISPKIKSSRTNRISLEAMKSSPPIPETSSGVIGWRSSLREHNLEVFGRLYISPRHTIISLTPDGITRPRFIVLG